MTNLIFLAACALLFVESIYMVLRCAYDDGLLGKLWLGGIWIGCGGLLIDQLGGHPYLIARPMALVFLCAALFLLRHLVNFERYERARRAGRRRAGDAGGETATAPNERSPQR